VHAAHASDNKGVGGNNVVLASPPGGSNSNRSLHPAAAAMSRIGPDGIPVVTRELIEKVLGPPRYDGASNDLRSSGLIPGIVAGLSWTAVGGDIMYIEAAVMPGTGQLQLTGQLGDVIKESAHIAMSWVQSHAQTLGLVDDAASSSESGGGGGGGGSGGSGGRRQGGNLPPGMYASAPPTQAVQSGGGWRALARPRSPRPTAAAAATAFSAVVTFTSIYPRAPYPRTDRPPGLPCAPRWCRCSAGGP
jgi:ATP-dependent Lon protease